MTVRTHNPAPPNQIPVERYADLRRWLAGVREDKFNLLFVTGTPGLGKSREVRYALAGREFLLIEGHATPLQTFISLYRHRGQPVVIDDENSFHAHPQKVSLMNCLCGTEPVKRLAWHTTSPLLEEAGVPPAFTTTSKVVVITNRLAATAPQVAALFDRGCLLRFDPPADEIHAQVERWLGDPEVLTFFAERLRVIPHPSMRQYVHAAEMKAAGIDWRATLTELWAGGPLAVYDRVRADPTLATEQARQAKFHELGCGVRATYFRAKKKWERAVPAARPAAEGGDCETDRGETVPAEPSDGGESLRLTGTDAGVPTGAA